MSRLRVLVAEDQYLVREGTRHLPENHGGPDVVGVAADYDSVLASLVPVRISGAWDVMSCAL